MNCILYLELRLKSYVRRKILYTFPVLLCSFRFPVFRPMKPKVHSRQPTAHSAQAPSAHKEVLLYCTLQTAYQHYKTRRYYELGTLLSEKLIVNRDDEYRSNLIVDMPAARRVCSTSLMARLHTEDITHTLVVCRTLFQLPQYRTPYTVPVRSMFDLCKFRLSKFLLESRMAHVNGGIMQGKIMIFRFWRLRVKVFLFMHGSWLAQN